MLKPICLGNISKDCSADNMKKTGLNGYVYEFSVDYRKFKSNLDESLPLINDYLITKCVKCLNLLKKCFS